ncbi:MAG: hypothetical protein KF709_10045 [Gemmatimonadaceae bacterium]|nr:hypothetical protein [Gemmatimonadaceae bacterium]
MLAAAPMPAAGQVDSVLAARYFAEAATLCQREGGRLWGISLCGPLVFADAQTQTLATSQPAPAAARPRVLGFVNAPIAWGEERWAAYVWAMIPAEDAGARGRLLLHEMFHRVQPQLGLVVSAEPNEHLDALEGRYWLRLEYRALGRALASEADARRAALADALAFRAERRRIFPEAAARERADEIREGLAQYTGTVVAFDTPAAAIADARQQLVHSDTAPSFVRTFAYPLGTAYGLLLDGYASGWTRRITPSSDLGELVATAANVSPAAEPAGAAQQYGGDELRAVEVERDRVQREHVAALRRRYVEGPVLIVPRGRGAALITRGATSIPGEGIVYLSYRVTAPWGSLESTGMLESSDGETLRLPAPFRTDGDTLIGETWRLVVGTGWRVESGSRPGDFVLRQAP